MNEDKWTKLWSDPFPDVVLQFPNPNGGASSFGSVTGTFDDVTIQILQ
jgi:hypothetical protein